MANMIYVPQRINVQMAASQEHPEGQVYILQPGYQEVPEGLEDHPVIRRLQGPTPGASKRTEKLAEAERKHAEAVGKADAELAEARAEALKDQLDETNQLSEEWEERRNYSAERGWTHLEQHPIQEVARAAAITGHPPHVYTSAQFTQKPQGIEEPKKAREALQSESDQKKQAAKRERVDQ
jgi:hypothetical protein